ncbi:MAG: GNAT family N-acetyltransferase [Christensenellales bacterium]
MPKMQRSQEQFPDCFIDYFNTTYYDDLMESYDISSFCCGIQEYDVFLKDNALEYMRLGISHTYLLFHKESNEVIGYFSISMSGLRLTNTEKEVCGISHVPYNQCPCLRLGKLAINEKFRRKGYGAYIIEIVKGIALLLNEESIACRLIVVDADVQHDANNLYFYEKCGFVRSECGNKKRVDIIGMFVDIYGQPIIYVKSNDANEA